jgi:hypothetical protein
MKSLAMGNLGEGLSVAIQTQYFGSNMLNETFKRKFLI